MTKDKIKKHINDHLVLYSVGLSVGIAGITVLIMRGVASQQNDSVIHGVAGSVIHGARNHVVMNNVSYFSSDRQGPPSWVVRCVETGAIFTSQRKAALEMGLPESDISRHLNGILEHVNDYTFERICMAA